MRLDPRCPRIALAALATLAVSIVTTATAHDLDDFTIHDPSLSFRLLYEVGRSGDPAGIPPRDEPNGPGFDQTVLWFPAGDGNKIIRTVGDPNPFGDSYVRLWRKVNRSGEATDLFSYTYIGDGGGFSMFSCDAREREFYDPFEGTVMVVTSVDLESGFDCETSQVWLIEGLPRVRSAGGCPNPPGDLAPGTLDESTEPPTWHPRGDGSVNVGDVVTLLRAAVGSQTIDCGP